MKPVFYFKKLYRLRLKERFVAKLKLTSNEKLIFIAFILIKEQFDLGDPVGSFVPERTFSV